jgi:hypothetical protein
MAARADVLTFDESSLGDTSTGADPGLAQDYHGFDNTNFFVLDPTAFGGWDTEAAVSDPNVAVNAYGAPAALTRDDPFNFLSAYFANGLGDRVFPAGTSPITVTVEGRDTIGGSVTHSVTFDVAEAPALFTFNWGGVRELDFSSTGRTFTHFSMDDLSYSFGPLDTSSGTPEPASWALMTAGFGLAGGLLRRRTAARA